MRGQSKVSTPIFITIGCLGLAACGGGGGSRPAPIPIATPNITSPPPAPAPEPATVESFKTDEFNLSWGLDAINAAEAYAAGYTGKNTIIAIIDFNFDLESSELNLHPASRGPNQEAVDIYEAQIGEPSSTTPHGNAVAVTAAGLKNDTAIHGVAFDATILAIDFFSKVHSREVTQNGILFTVSDPWSYGIDQGARIFNKSFGFDEGDTIDHPPPVNQRYVLEYETQAVALGGLVVASAGNNSDPEPSLANLQALNRLSEQGLLNSGPGAYIIVGSVDEDLTISSFSDRAGTGASRFNYLVAPGEDVVFPWTDGLVIGSGTSFAAPYVSGAAAVILSRWPTLTGREVADILFKTATDLGDPGIDEIYGNGLLNLDQALKPVGQAKIAVKTSKTQAVSGAAVQLGPAFGDAAGLRAGLSDVLITDDFNRDFQIDASGLIASTGGRTNIEARFDARRNWRSASLAVTSGYQLNYSLNRDRRSAPAFALAGQAEGDFAPTTDAVFEFTGQYDGKKWIVGAGRSVSSALAQDPYDQAMSGGFSLTGTQDSIVPTGRGLYLAVNNPLSDTTDIWFGASQAKTPGQPQHAVEALRRNTQTTAVAMRIDHYRETKRFSAELGISRENGSLLGGRSTGGLTVANGASTGWLTLAGGWYIGSLTLTSSATVAVTDPKGQSASVLNNLGLITSSAFELKATVRGTILEDDSISLSVRQPLRVENSTALLTRGTGLDATGAVLFSDSRISLAPAGREVAVEAAYQARINGWTLEANAAYRRDAGHFAGVKDALFAFNIGRYF